MPTKLDERLVADALTALRHWTGDATGITRTVELPADGSEAVLREVAVSADSLGHHPEVERAGTRTTFTLRTGSEGGVTELDIALASRIDDIVRRVGGVADAAPTPPGRPGRRRDGGRLGGRGGPRPGVGAEPGRPGGAVRGRAQRPRRRARRPRARS